MNNPLENIDNIPWQVQRYKELTSQRLSVYFDVQDFEEIIEYFAYESDFKTSLKVAEYACQVHPSSVNLMLRKAQLLAAVNKEKHALELLNLVENLEPNNHEIFLTKGAIYSQLKNYEKAIEEYNKAVGESDEPDSVYCNIAFEYENMGNYDKTIEYLSKALEVNPENDLAMYEAAYCFDLLSLNEESINFFTRLIDRHPYSVEAWFNLGLSYINTELYEKALDAFEYALAIEPEHHSSIFHTGYAFSLLGRNQEAIAIYKSLLEQDTEDSDAMIHYYIGECYEKMEEYQNARKYYRKATKINGELTDAWIGMGICENALGNAKSAVKHVLKGLEMDPENTAYLSILADVYFQNFNYDKGSLYYEKAIASSPKEESIRIDYADALTEHELFDKASDVITIAIEELTPSAVLYYRMAAILFLSGRKNDGAFFLEEALVMDYEKHDAMLEQYPELKDIKEVTTLINLYSN